MPAQGTTLIDFGSTPGSYDTSVAVTGQTSMTGSEYAEAFLMATTSPDHNLVEHQIAPISLRCGVPSAGVGFTIYATSEILLTGQFTVRWVWN
jgi:hypothetical protein